MSNRKIDYWRVIRKKTSRGLVVVAEKPKVKVAVVSEILTLLTHLFIFRRKMKIDPLLGKSPRERVIDEIIDFMKTEGITLSFKKLLNHAANSTNRKLNSPKRVVTIQINDPIIFDKRNKVLWENHPYQITDVTKEDRYRKILLKAQEKTIYKMIYNRMILIHNFKMDDIDFLPLEDLWQKYLEAKAEYDKFLKILNDPS